MQEKESNMRLSIELTNLSLETLFGITLQSLMIPSRDPWDRIVYPIHKLMIDSFLICFPMDYRDFSVKSKVVIHCFKQWDYDFRFSLFVNSFYRR